MSFVLGEDLVVRKFKLLDGAVDQLESSEREDVRAELEARFALMSGEFRRLFLVLEAALKLEPDKDTQLGEIRALASLGEKSVDALRSLIESPDARVRTMAVRALAGGHATGPWPWPWPDPRPSP